MSEAWTLPGYEVQSLIGFGATGEVWRARELATGETVAVKRLAEGADPAAVEAVRRDATALRTLGTPYVVRLRQVLDDGARVVLVLDHAPGGSLAGLLSRRRVLEPGEVVTVAAPLAQALAAAHARGLVHGDISPANVLFTSDGMPLLAGLGLARAAGARLAQTDGAAELVDPAVAAGAEACPAADVWALAALCHLLLAGVPPQDGAAVGDVPGAAAPGGRAPLGRLAPGVPAPLVAAVERGLAADRTSRPDAATFAGLLRRAHVAAPVRLSASTAPVPPVEARSPAHLRPPSSPEPGAPRRRPSTGALTAVGLGLLVLAGAAGGWHWGRVGEPQARTLPEPLPALADGRLRAVSSPAPAAAPDWPGLLDRLDAVRAAAFARADPEALTAVYARDSPGLLADRRLVQRLAAAGETAHGVRHAVRAVDVLDVGADRARLRVVDVLAPYELRDAAGAVVRRAPGRGAASYVVELVRTPAGWRLVEVVPG